MPMLAVKGLGRPPLPFSDRLMDVRGDCARFALAGVWQEDGKLLAAHARDEMPARASRLRIARAKACSAASPTRWPQSVL